MTDTSLPSPEGNTQGDNTTGNTGENTPPAPTPENPATQDAAPAIDFGTPATHDAPVAPPAPAAPVPPVAPESVVPAPVPPVALTYTAPPAAPIAPIVPAAAPPVAPAYAAPGYPAPAAGSAYPAPPRFSQYDAVTPPAKPKTLGLIAMYGAIGVLVLSVVASILIGISIAPYSTTTSDGGFTFNSADMGNQPGAAGLGLAIFAHIGLGTLLGVTALVLGIVAAATKRGRRFGVVGLIVAAVAPVISLIVYIASAAAAVAAR